MNNIIYVKVRENEMATIVGSDEISDVGADTAN